MLWFFSLAFAQDTVAPQEKAEIECSDLHWSSGQGRCKALQVDLNYWSSFLLALESKKNTMKPSRYQYLRNYYIQKMEDISEKLEEMSVVPEFEIPEPIYVSESTPQLRVGAAGAWTYNETSYTSASELQSFVNASVIGFGTGHFYVASKTGDLTEGSRGRAIFGLEAVTAVAMTVAAGNLAFPSAYADRDYTQVYSSTLGVSAVAFSLTRLYEMVDAPAAARRANARATEVHVESEYKTK